MSCNLDLSLVSPANSGDDQTPHHHRRPDQPQPQPLTIFYEGTYCVCDVTEFQARAIIMLAGSSQETASAAADDKSVTSPGVNEQQRRTGSLATETPAAAPPAVGLSMKRSLQRFLQKRKGRAQAAGAAPYSRATAVQKKELLQFQINGFQIVAP